MGMKNQKTLSSNSKDSEGLRTPVNECGMFTSQSSFLTTSRYINRCRRDSVKQAPFDHNKPRINLTRLNLYHLVASIINPTRFRNRQRSPQKSPQNRNLNLQKDFSDQTQRNNQTMTTHKSTKRPTSRQRIKR